MPALEAATLAEGADEPRPSPKDEASSQGAVAAGHPLSEHGARDLVDKSALLIAATEAALAAALAAGGDKQLEDSLRDRLRMIRKRAATIFEQSRIHLHAVQMDRHQKVLAQRVESKAKEAASKELALTVKLRQAEAAVAVAKGKEAAVEARRKAGEAKAKKG